MAKTKLKKTIMFFIKLSLLALLLMAAFFSVIALYACGAKLDANALQSGGFIAFYDDEGAAIDDGLFGEVSVKELPQHVYNAFIAIEDKRFYTHGGVDYKRIAAAAVNNLTSFSLKEGASTITQQLVKNTQLSPEKTFLRKAKEIKLAFDVEKDYTKQQIIDRYLSVIYFGSGCYGIENAAKYYFDVSAKDLNAGQAAALASIIKSPSGYSPYSNYQRLMNRKNIVLTQMKKNKLIDEQSFDEYYGKDIEFCSKNSTTNAFSDYVRMSLSEMADLLQLDLKEAKKLNYKIYTYLNTDLQSAAYNIINSEAYYDDFNTTDSSAIVIDSRSGAVNTAVLKSRFSLNSIQRQPGSAIKPILVYAPALEYGIIAPSTQILDEPTNFEGYNPSNYKNKYYGHVSARLCAAYSLNVPAVKLLNSVGIERAKQFSAAAGISYEKEDNHLGLALGGFSKGITPLELSSSYIPLSNGGIYRKPAFIKKITDKDGKVIYSHNVQDKRAMRDDTAYLTTDMLKETVKTGTAKKLADLGIDIAAKTGTVGNEKYNTDAYSIAYSSTKVYSIWMGALGKEKLSLKTTGGNHATSIIKDVIKKDIAQNGKPDNFIMPGSVLEAEIDSEYLRINHAIKLATALTPPLYKDKELFSSLHPPIEYSDLFSIPQVDNAYIDLSDTQIKISFDAKQYYTYTITKFENGIEKQDVFAEIINKNGKVTITDTLQHGKTYYYMILPKLKYKNNENVVTGTPYISEKYITNYDFNPKDDKDNTDWWDLLD